MKKELVVGLMAVMLMASISTVFASVQPVPKVTGCITMSNPSQQAVFCAFDQSAIDKPAKGTFEYWNYEYPGLLHYTADILCAWVDSADARFMFRIPEGWPGLSGLYVVVSVHDGGTPGTDGDTYGHTSTWDLTTAENWCLYGVSVTNYPITSGNLVVHS